MSKTPNEKRWPKVGAVKYGNKDFKKLPKERELNAGEIMHLVAAYQKTEDLVKAAKEVNTTWDNAADVIRRAIQDNPESFYSGEAKMWMGLTARFIAVECMKHAFRNIDKLDANKAMYTAQIAGNLADNYMKSWKESGEKTGGSDLDAIRRKADEVERKLAKLRNADTGEGASTAEATGATSEPATTVGADA